MTSAPHDTSQILTVTNFQDLVSRRFQDGINAICWNRELRGDFSEIVERVHLTENLVVLEPQKLLELRLSDSGRLARDIIINDFNLLKAHGASPIINLIRNYERDEDYPFFPTDVYSYHVDRSPIPTSTFLCTYYGAASEILPNAEVEQKILVPEIRTELRKLFDGAEDGFSDFLKEHFFDLHYQAKQEARPIDLGLGNLWRLAIDHPESEVLPCVHRAPMETFGQKRLMLIC